LRPASSLCTHELATISALTTLGNAQPQLKVHIAQKRSAVEISLRTYQRWIQGRDGSAIDGLKDSRRVTYEGLVCRYANPAAGYLPESNQHFNCVA